MKLSTRILLPVAFAITATGAFAEGPIFVEPAFQSTLSRAEVRAQAVQARDAGLLQLGEGVQVAQNTSNSTLSRVQVRAEAAEALRLGLHNGGEASVVATSAQVEQIRMAGLRAVQGNNLASGQSGTQTN